MKNLLNKIQKSEYKCDDFGRGKSPVAKARNRRMIKRKAKALLEKNLNDRA